MAKERLYRYACKVNGIFNTGVTWNTNRENVIKDVKANYGPDTKRIIVVWLKEGTLEYNLARTLVD